MVPLQPYRCFGSFTFQQREPAKSSCVIVGEQVHQTAGWTSAAHSFTHKLLKRLNKPPESPYIIVRSQFLGNNNELLPNYRDVFY